VVSLNLPINTQLLGSLASRSTHPKFINSFNILAKAVLPWEPQVINPLWERTKAECLAILKKHGIPQLLATTNSCAHRRNLSADKPQCGVCSQCVDRRFASIAAGLEVYDPKERYVKDIFFDALDGNDITMADSYLRFAKQVQSLSSEAIYLNYPQMAEAILSLDSSPESTALKYASLIHRHAISVIDVMEQQVKTAAKDLVLSNLPATCLISLSVQSSVPIAPVPAANAPLSNFQYSEDYRSVQWNGQTFTFTSQQAEVIGMLHHAFKAGTRDLSWEQIQTRLNGIERYPARMSDIFKSSPAWRTLIITVRRGIYRLAI
jgi:Queuosine biosynthesis protein QueC